MDSVEQMLNSIEQTDWGVYSFFGHHPIAQGIKEWQVQYAGWYLGSPLGGAIVASLAVAMFLLRRKPWSALTVLGSFAAAALLGEGIRYWVPRKRPSDAQNWLGPENMTGSYPSTGVLLFTLGVILLGFAIWGLSPRSAVRAGYVLLAALLVGWVILSELLLSTNFLTDILGAVAGAGLMGWGAYLVLKCTS